jgi:GNAT superfamily N-acetyltransferase
MSNEQALTVRPLTPERFSDLAALFEEGGDPKWSWCTYFRFRGASFSKSSSSEHRGMLRDLAQQRPSTAPALGLIAYRADRAVGWVSFGPRREFGRLAHSVLLAPVDDAPVWSIVCFVVSRRSRGQGIAAQLLDHAIDYARSHGASMLEAYPADTADGRVSAGVAYKGTLAMFERAGFREVARRQWNATTPERPIVRLDLVPGPGGGDRLPNRRESGPAEGPAGRAPA